MTTLTQTLPPRVAVLPALPDQFEVRVLEEDGQLGIRQNGFECRFTRAIRRALVLMGYLPELVSVGRRIRGYSVVSIFLRDPESSHMYRFDDLDQIALYDNGGNPPPCTVTLRKVQAEA